MADDLLGELRVQITGDTAQYDKTLKTTESKTEKFASKTAASLKNFSKRVAQFTTAGIVAVGAASIKFASDLGESINAVNVVFGESAGIIQGWGDTAAEQAGLSKSAFNESSALIGTLLKKTGKDFDNVALDTIEVTKRAADLASVFNKDLSVATTAVGAALRGETEPIRAFAIDVSAAAVEAEALSSGMVQNKADITEAIKVQARYNLILKQSKNVAGDFQNTNDQLANSSRVLKAELENAGAELGETFLPAIAKGATGLVKLTRAAKEQAPAVGNFLVKAWTNLRAAVETAIVKLSGIFGLHIKIYGALIEQAIKLGKIIVKPFILLGATVAKVYATVINETSKFGASITETFTVIVTKAKLAFTSLGTTIVENVLGAVEKLLGVAAKIPVIGNKFKEVADSVGSIKDSFGAASDAAIKFQEDAVSAAEAEKQASQEAFQARLEAIETEKQAKLEELKLKEEAEIESQNNITNSFIENKEKEAEVSTRIEKEKVESLLKSAKAYSSNVIGIFDNITSVQLNNLETEKNAKIEQLKQQGLSEEDFAKKKEEIEKEYQRKKYKAELSAFNARKALRLIDIAIDTASAIVEALPNIPLSIAVGALGLSQAAVVASQPAPPPPQLNSGAVVRGTTAGTPVIVGENNASELILGGGAKGEPLLEEFADKINERGGNEAVVINLYSTFNLSDESQTRDAAEKLYPALQTIKSRRGAV